MEQLNEQLKSSNTALLTTHSELEESNRRLEQLNRNLEELTYEEHEFIETRFRESGAIRRQSKIELRLRDVTDRNIEPVPPSSLESFEYPSAGFNCLCVVLLQARLIEVKQSRERHLRRIGVDLSPSLLFVFKLSIRQFPIVGFEAFLDQLALNSEDRIIRPRC